MVRITLVAALLVAGCYHDARPATVANQAKAPDHAATANDVLGFLPADAEVVVGFDLRPLRRSPLWQAYEPTVIAALSSRLAGIQAQCGFDPLAALQWGTLAVRQEHAVFVVHGLPREQFVACIAKGVPPGVSVSRDGDAFTWTEGDSKRLVMSFVDPTTVVAVNWPGATKHALDATLAAGSPLRGSPAFLALYRRLEPGAALWLLVRSKATLEKLSSLGVHASDVYLTVRATDLLVISVHVVVAGPDEATRFAQQLNAQAISTRSMFQRFEATADGNVTSLAIELTRPQLDALLAMIGGMIKP